MWIVFVNLWNFDVKEWNRPIKYLERHAQHQHLCSHLLMSLDRDCFLILSVPLHLRPPVWALAPWGFSVSPPFFHQEQIPSRLLRRFYLRGLITVLHLFLRRIQRFPLPLQENLHFRVLQSHKILKFSCYLVNRCMMKVRKSNVSRKRKLHSLHRWNPSGDGMLN